MTILMTGLCEKGADQIWKQCNDAMYAQGVTWLEEAAYAGDAEAWFFLGHCYSWGDGAVGRRCGLMGLFWTRSPGAPRGWPRHRPPRLCSLPAAGVGGKCPGSVRSAARRSV